MYVCMYFDGGEGVVIIATPIHTAQPAVGPIAVTPVHRFTVQILSVPPR